MPDIISQKLILVLEAVDKTAGVLASAEANMAKMARATNKLNKEMKTQFSDMQQVTGSLADKIGELGKRVDTLGAPVQKATSSFSGFGKSFAAAGIALTVGLTVPLKNLGQTMITQVGQVEQYRVAFDSMLKSAQLGGRLFQELTTLAYKTPFTIPEVVGAGKQLLAYGYSLSEVTAEVGRLGDISSGIGVPIGDITYLMGTLRAQGRAYTRDILQLANRGVPIWGELAKVMGTTEGGVQKLLEAGKVGFPQVEQAMRNMTDEGGLFYKMMDKQSMTLLGTLSNLKDSFIKVSMSILGVDSATGDVTKGGTFEKLKNALQGLLGIMNNFVEYYSKLDQVTKNFITTFVVLLALIGPTIGIVVALGAAFFSSFAVITAVSLAIAGLVAAYVSFKPAATEAEKANMEFVNSFNEGLDISKKTSDQMIQNISAEYEEMAKPAVKFYKESVDRANADYDEQMKRAKKLTLSKNEEEVKSGFELMAIAIANKGKLSKVDLEKYNGMMADSNAFRDKQVYEQIKYDRKVNEEAVKFAKANGGIYDAGNKRILLGSDAVWFLQLEGLKSWAATSLTVLSTFFQKVALYFDNHAKNLASSFVNSFDLLDAFVYGKKIPKLLPVYGTGGIDAELKRLDKESGATLDSIALKHAQVLSGSYDDITSMAYALNTINATHDKLLRDTPGSSGTGGMGEAGAGAAKVNPVLKALEESLNALGVFAIRAGGEMMGAFTDAADGVKKAEKALVDLAETNRTLMGDFTRLGIVIDSALNDIAAPDSVTDSLKDVQDKLKDMTSEVNTLISDHSKFVQAAQKDIESYGESVAKVNDKFKKLGEEAGAKATSTLVTDYRKALEDQVTLAEKIKTAKQKQIEGKWQDWAENQKEIDALNAEKKKADQSVADVDLIRTGKKTILGFDPAELQAAFDDVNQRRKLSDIEYAEWKLKHEKDLLEKQKQQELKDLEVMKYINEQVVAGKPENYFNLTEQNLSLKFPEISETALAAAAAAQTEEAKYNEQLGKMKTRLQALAEEEKKIFENTTAEVKTQLDILTGYQDAFANGSLQRLIDKYKELQKAAKAALAAGATLGYKETPLTPLPPVTASAKSISPVPVPAYSGNNVSAIQAEVNKASTAKKIVSTLSDVRKGAVGLPINSVGTAGLLKPFASGGFTGTGAPAGIVHAGEWVAPKWMVDSMSPTFNALENVRKGGTGGNMGANISVLSGANVTISGGSDERSLARTITGEITRALQAQRCGIATHV